MIDLKNIYSLSDFQRKTREHIRRLKRTRRPEVLTVNGKAEVVVQDAQSYQELLDALDEANRGRHPGRSGIAGTRRRVRLEGSLNTIPYVKIEGQSFYRSLH